MTSLIDKNKSCEPPEEKKCKEPKKRVEKEPECIEPQPPEVVNKVLFDSCLAIDESELELDKITPMQFKTGLLEDNAKEGLRVLINTYFGIPVSLKHSKGTACKETHIAHFIGVIMITKGNEKKTGDEIVPRRITNGLDSVLIHGSADPLVQERAKCLEDCKVEPIYVIWKECDKRVTRKLLYTAETCHEETIDLMEALDKCVQSKGFLQLQ